MLMRLMRIVHIGNKRVFKPDDTMTQTCTHVATSVLYRVRLTEL